VNPLESISELSKRLRGQTIQIVRSERTRVAMARILMMEIRNQGLCRNPARADVRG
jgi:hypothetical protein